MKKTLFTAMLAVAVLGGGVFAADYIPTYCKGLTAWEGKDYFGAYSTTEDVQGGELIIFRLDDKGPDWRSINFYGGFSSAAAATANTVTMESGQVGSITGGAAPSTASNNSVTVSNGITGSITGGVAERGEAQNNVVTVAGGQVGGITGGASQSIAAKNIISVDGGTVASITGGVAGGGCARDNVVTVTAGTVGAIIGGVAGDLAHANTVTVTGGTVESITGGMGWEAAYNTVIVAGGTVEQDIVGGKGEIRDIGKNKVILVGEGAKYGEGIGEISGSAFSVGGSIMAAAGAAPTAGEGIHIYGAGITVGGALGGAAEINFHLSANLLDSTALPMLTMTSKETPLDFGSFELTFQAEDEMDWKPGQSITLVSSALGLTVPQELLDKEYDIKATRADAATAKLVLNQDRTLLKLTVPGVPEPTTNALSLLGLALLAGRRRRL